MTYGIILAAGQSSRIKNLLSGPVCGGCLVDSSSRSDGTPSDKLLVNIAGKPLIYYTIASFNDHSEINEIIIVANAKNKKVIQELVKKNNFKKVKKIILGGNLRQKSLENGLKEIKKAKKDDIILIQNGANPLPSFEEISKVIASAKSYGAAIAGHFSVSTVKEVNEAHITKTHDREKIFLSETPQAAKYEIIKKASDYVKKKKLVVTDESMMLELIGQKVAYIEANPNNFKITTEADIQKLKGILGDTGDDFIVGIGLDSHMFDQEKKGLVLGGIKLPEEPKLKANSDGDVILHAIFNALSQAIGGKSIGHYVDEICRKGETNSKKYIEIIFKKVYQKGFHINNIGLMIEAKTPKIDTLSDKIKNSLSKILEIPVYKIGITATSGENLTAFGRGLGIQCFAIVSLKKG